MSESGKNKKKNLASTHDNKYTHTQIKQNTELIKA